MQNPTSSLFSQGRMRVIAVVVVIVLVLLLWSAISRNNYDPALFALCQNHAASTFRSYESPGYRILPVDTDSNSLAQDIFDKMSPDVRAAPGQVDMVACIQTKQVEFSFDPNTCSRKRIVTEIFFVDPGSKRIGFNNQFNGGNPPNCTANQKATQGTPPDPRSVINHINNVGGDLRYAQQRRAAESSPITQIARLLATLLPLLLGIPLIVFVWFVIAPPEVAVGWALRHPSRLARLILLSIGLMLSSVTLGLYPIVVWIVAFIAYRRDRFDNKTRRKFIKSSPFYAYGQYLDSTQLIFGKKDLDSSPAQSAAQVSTIMQSILNAATGANRPQIEIVDVSVDYPKFFIEVQHTTTLQSTITYLFNVSYELKNYRILWFNLVRGRVNFWWAGFWFVFYAPFTIFSWGWPTLRDMFSIKAALAAAIDYTYDHFDITGWNAIFQQQVANALIKALDEAGFDVEYYKANPPVYVDQRYSTNISGDGNAVGIASGDRNNVNVRAESGHRAAATNRPNLATFATPEQPVPGKPYEGEIDDIFVASPVPPKAASPTMPTNAPSTNTGDAGTSASNIGDQPPTIDDPRDLSNS